MACAAVGFTPRDDALKPFGGGELTLKMRPVFGQDVQIDVPAEPIRYERVKQARRAARREPRHAQDIEPLGELAEALLKEEVLRPHRSEALGPALGHLLLALRREARQGRGDLMRLRQLKVGRDAAATSPSRSGQDLYAAWLRDAEAPAGRIAYSDHQLRHVLTHRDADLAQRSKPDGFRYCSQCTTSEIPPLMIALAQSRQGLSVTYMIFRFGLL